jgi:hypothetical protein
MTIDTRRLQAALRRLPTRRRWTVQETPMDYDFSARRRLVPLDPESYDFPLERGWLQLLIFGEYDYSEGGGARPFLGIRNTDGAVLGLDFERDKKPLFLLNSGVDSFVRTFEALDKYLGKGRALPDDVEKTVRAIDPRAYRKSDWKPFVRFALQREDN